MLSYILSYILFFTFYLTCYLTCYLTSDLAFYLTFYLTCYLTSYLTCYPVCFLFFIRCFFLHVILHPFFRSRHIINDSWQRKPFVQIVVACSPKGHMLKNGNARVLLVSFRLYLVKNHPARSAHQRERCGSVYLRWKAPNGQIGHPLREQTDSP